jgi:hypothetical protein
MLNLVVAGDVPVYAFHFVVCTNRGSSELKKNTIQTCRTTERIETGQTLALALAREHISTQSV